MSSRCLDCAAIIPMGTRCPGCARTHARRSGWGNSRQWQRLRDQAYVRQRGRCAICGAGMARDAYDLDHVLPASRGGAATAENTQALCRECHAWKSERWDAT